MSALISPSSTADPRLASYTNLRDMELRKSYETEHGLFMAEGEKIILRALEHGLTPQSFLLTPRWFESLQPHIEPTGADCFLLSEAEIEEVAGFHVHRGALAAFSRPEPQTPETLLAASSRILVLEDLADHTNIGAIFRTAAALNWDAIILSPRCADPWYRRSLKVSMGAVFTIPFAVADDWYVLPDLLNTAGFQSVAMTLAPDSVPLDELRKGNQTRLAVIVGSEGHGISHHWQTEATSRVTIPMAEQIDSLNVAASVAIACWELRVR